MRLGVACILALVLTGCSGGGGSSASGVESGDDLAHLVGCTGYTGDSEEIFITEGGACKLDGERIFVAYFADADALDSYVEVGADFGGLYLVGPNWIVGGKRATLEDLREAHGGKISG